MSPCLCFVLFYPTFSSLANETKPPMAPKFMVPKAELGILIGCARNKPLDFFLAWKFYHVLLYKDVRV